VRQRDPRPARVSLGLLKLGPDFPQRDSFEVTHYLRFKETGRYRLYVVTRSVVSVDA